jgi:hypothetical protein
MKIIITEEQYKEVIVENTFKDVMSSLKLNSSIIFTFGTGVSAFMGPVEKLLTKSNFSFNKQEIVLLIITSFALLVNDSNKTKLLEEITDKGLIKAFKGVFEFIKNATEIIKATIKNILGVTYNLSEILGFVFLLNPIMKILESIINDRNITVDNVSMLLTGIVLSGIVFSIKSLLGRGKDYFSKNKSITEDVNPSSSAVKNICDAKKFCQVQGKITFGQLRELVESAKTKRLLLHIGEGGYKALLRLMPWYIPQLALAGFTGSLIRALSKIFKPTLEETTNYKTWWGKIILKTFNLVEGELGTGDPLSKIFFISDGLLTMLDDKQKVKFARYISELASQKSDDEEVPEFFVENELRNWLNEKFLLYPPLQPKQFSNEGITEGVSKTIITENFVRLSEKETKNLIDSLIEMGFDEEDSEYELNNLINYYDNLSNKITLYRIVFSDSSDTIDTQYPGSHYSINKKNLIDSHYSSLRDSSYGENAYLIQVVAEKQMIDFFESIKNNILYPNEEEITLKNKGFGVRIIKITPVFY